MFVLLYIWFSAYIVTRRTDTCVWPKHLRSSSNIAVESSRNFPNISQTSSGNTFALIYVSKKQSLVFSSEVRAHAEHIFQRHFALPFLTCLWHSSRHFEVLCCCLYTKKIKLVRGTHIRAHAVQVQITKAP